MKRVLLLAVVILATGAWARKKKPPDPDKHDAPAYLTLNGERTRVVWTDGDSFSIKEGEFKGRGTRLQGYNTLEAYGPVHRWGEWTAPELFEIAKASSTVAASQEWKCSTDGKEDGYHRLLIRCPELTVEIVKQGHAMAYAVEGEKVDPKVLAAQQDAMSAGRGMWKKGVVKGVMTSAHSLGEDGDDAPAYNRVVDTRTGAALKRKHEKKYSTCEEVCESTEGDQSCMVYVPFKIRYRNKPDCLKHVVHEATPSE